MYDTLSEGKHSNNNILRITTIIKQNHTAKQTENRSKSETRPIMGMDGRRMYSRMQYHIIRGCIARTQN